MRVASTPKVVKKLYQSKISSKNPAKAWNREFKKIDDKKIVAMLEQMINAPENHEDVAWTFAGFALSELSIRKWGKKHPRTLEALKQAIAEHSKQCFISFNYTFEAAGIVDPLSKNQGKIKIVHPYAYSEVAKKIISEWESSKTHLSLEDYIASHVKKKDKHYLKQHKITYLSPKEHDQYRVTFEDNRVKIGEQTPSDGRYMFVLGGDTPTLMAGVKIKGEFHHSSFFAGAPVICAGQFEIEDGKIVSSRLKSGHYRPIAEHGEAFRQFLARPENLGPIEAANLVIKPHDN